MDKNEMIMKLAEKIDADVKDGFMTIGNAISAPMAEGRSVAWLVGALTALKNTTKIVSDNIMKFDGADKIEAQAAEIIAKASCVSEGYSYKSEVSL